MITLRDDWRDAAAWDSFVTRHEEGRFCHLFGYAAVLGCYAYIPRNICFLKHREIVGVLPAVQVNSAFFRPRLVSQPFSEYGGLLLDSGLGEDEVAEVFRALRTFGQRLGHVDAIEMHGNHGVPEHCRENWARPSVEYQVAVLPLNRSIDEIWRKVLEYSARKQINQAVKQGLTVDFTCNEQVIRDHFFPLYLRSMKRLGVPPHSVEYFLRCKQIFGERMIIVWAKKGAKPIAGLLGFSCGGRVSIVSIASDESEWSLRPNDFVHWELIKWAVEHNHGNFDFGSVRYQGQAVFKKKWGCNVIPHKLYVLPIRADAQPRAINSSSRSMTAMANLWSRYMPHSPARVIGPIIRKHLAR